MQDHMLFLLDAKQDDLIKSRAGFDIGGTRRLLQKRAFVARPLAVRRRFASVSKCLSQNLGADPPEHK